MFCKNFEKIIDKVMLITYICLFVENASQLQLEPFFTKKGYNQKTGEI